MADARDFVIRSSTGAPVVGATPTVIARSIAGAVRTPPAIVEHGIGVYRFTPTDDDEAVGTVVHIDCGAGREPRRFTFACFKADNSNQFWALHVEDAAGALWTGSAPTVGGFAYTSPAGARTPPTLVAVEGAYLFVAVPTAADVAADVAIRITGPAGSSQAEWVGQTAAVVATSPDPIWPANPPQEPVPEASSATLFGREAYTRQLKALLPPGVLYNLEPDSVLSRLLEGCADELMRVNARGADLVNESDPRTATETLADWEQMLSLPDEFVTEIPGTTAQRRSAITAKYVGRGGQDLTFFTALVGACGYTLNLVEIFHSQILRAGFRVNDRCYDQTYAYTMRLTVTAGGGALAAADFERVVRSRTHAGVIVQFVYL